MGRAGDATAIHGRVLNRSKGPAVQSTRQQVDKAKYGAFARNALTTHPGIEVIEGLVAEVLLETDAHGHERVRGVGLADGSEVSADAVVITTGTFLGGLLHTGATKTPGGRVGEPPARGLSDNLRAMGFRLSRLKTGTPARLDARTIDYSVTEPQPSEDPVPRFVLPDDVVPPPPLIEQVHCHLTWTNAGTNAIIKEHLHESPMYSGQIEGRGPRYCPSIEDKVVRFADRDRHQVFLEPEGLDTHSVYPNGISTSLPAGVQAKFITTIPGLERAEMLRPGYAVEYDAVDARGLDHRLSSKTHRGLYFAGQVNGTSGYEEAGIQGLIAGANAALELLEREPLHIARDEGYAGVLVDDLVTQGCDEPYRMFTSRAEFRIMLREDNADARLSALALQAGLITQERFDRVLARRATIDALSTTLAKKGSIDDAPAWQQTRARAQHVYAGYLDRMRSEVARLRGDAATDLPLAADLDYDALEGLSNESKQRLAQVRPTSTAQASRIPGMTPAALMTLWAHARRLQKRHSRAQKDAPKRTAP